MTWRPSMQDYVSLADSLNKQKLIEKAEQAAAWGVPDNESTGYSQSELCSIIRQLVNYIKNT